MSKRKVVKDEIDQKILENHTECKKKPKVEDSSEADMPVKCENSVNVRFGDNKQESNEAERCVYIVENRLSLEIYPCDICGVQFNSLKDIEKHMEKVHTKENLVKNEGDASKPEFKCQICGKIKDSEVTFTRHLKIHGDHRKFECFICHRNFLIYAYLRRHLTRVHWNHSLNHNDFCVLCKRYFKNRKYLENHQKTVHSQVMFNCNFCDKSYKKKATLQWHVKIQHSQGQSKHKHKCPVCNKHFNNIHNMKIHRDTVHSNVRPHKCNLCERTFKTVAHRNSHERKYHNNNKKRPLKCAYCLKLYQTLDDLNNHQKIGCSVFKKKLQDLKVQSDSFSNSTYNCEICKKSFQSSNELILHQSVHIVKVEDEKQFQCYKCGRYYKAAIYLRAHLKAVHSSGRSDFCNICNKYFKHNGYLKQHQDKVHSKVQFECNICNKFFKCNHNLQQHLKQQHTNVTLHKCQFCTKSFKTHILLRKHVQRIHPDIKEIEGNLREKIFEVKSTSSDIKPYNCDICGDEFKLVTEFEEHTKNVHTRIVPISVVDNKIVLSKPQYKCRICDKVLRNKTTLRKHHLLHTNGNIGNTSKRQYECYKCGNSVQSFNNLKNHMLENHSFRKPDAVPRKCCDICKEYSDNIRQLKEKLKQHLKMMHKRDYSRTYKCNFCNVVFRSRYRMAKHRKTHTESNEEKPSDNVSEISSSNFNDNEFEIKSEVKLENYQIVGQPHPDTIIVLD